MKNVGPNCGLGFRVQTVWVALAEHEDGDEGVVSIASVAADGTTHWFPLVAADPTRLEQITYEARKAAQVGNRSIRIVKFSTREVREVLHPDGRRERSS